MYKESVSFIFLFHGKQIGVQNKQIAGELFRGSHNLFVLHFDLFPLNPEKRHSFL